MTSRKFEQFSTPSLCIFSNKTYLLTIIMIVTSYIDDPWKQSCWWSTINDVTKFLIISDTPYSHCHPFLVINILLKKKHFLRPLYLDKIYRHFLKGIMLEVVHKLHYPIFIIFTPPPHIVKVFLIRVIYFPLPPPLVIMTSFRNNVDRKLVHYGIYHLALKHLREIRQ